MAQEIDNALEAELAGYSSYTVTPDKALDLFERARAAGCPVAHSNEMGGFYLALDYDVVKSLHSDWQTFSCSPTVVLPVVDRPGFPPLEFDPPEHTAWREIISQAFNAATPELVEEGVREDINRLIDSFADRGECDLVKDFAEEVPLLALCRVIGFDIDKRDKVRELTLRILADFEDPDEGPQSFMDFAMFGAGEVMSRLEDPVCFEFCEPCVHGVASQSRRLSQRDHRGPRVLRQHAQNPRIEVVDDRARLGHITHLSQSMIRID